jgi:hypothetical protein
LTKLCRRLQVHRSHCTRQRVVNLCPAAIPHFPSRKWLLNTGVILILAWHVLYLYIFIVFARMNLQPAQTIIIQSKHTTARESWSDFSPWPLACRMPCRSFDQSEKHNPIRLFKTSRDDPMISQLSRELWLHRGLVLVISVIFQWLWVSSMALVFPKFWKWFRNYSKFLTYKN